MRAPREEPIDRRQSSSRRRLGWNIVFVFRSDVAAWTRWRDPAKASLPDIRPDNVTLERKAAPKDRF
jgi:hypothetical protein